MKKLRNIFIIIGLLVIYIYVCNITLLPSSIIIFEGEELNLRTIVGINVRRANTGTAEVIQASTTVNSDQDNVYSSAGTFELNLDLFGTIPVKEIKVNVIPKTKIVPMGNLIGVKMYTSGVLVVGMSEIEGQDKQKYKPYINSGIEEGDMIVEINNKKVDTTDELIEVVNNSQGQEIQINYVRDDDEMVTSILPIKNESN